MNIWLIVTSASFPLEKKEWVISSSTSMFSKRERHTFVFTRTRRNSNHCRRRHYRVTLEGGRAPTSARHGTRVNRYRSRKGRKLHSGQRAHFIHHSGSTSDKTDIIGQTAAIARTQIQVFWQFKCIRIYFTCAWFQTVKQTMTQSDGDQQMKSPWLGKTIRTMINDHAEVRTYFEIRSI